MSKKGVFHGISGIGRGNAPGGSLCDRGVWSSLLGPDGAAALASVELMEREGFDLSRVLVVSGSGNNGGDGFAMARILYLKGIEAELWFVGNPDHLSKEAALQKKICENYGMKFVRNLPAGEYTTIVDAVFGSGLSREVKGSYREVIESINRHPAKVFAVDILR